MCPRRQGCPSCSSRQQARCLDTSRDAHPDPAGHGSVLRPPPRCSEQESKAVNGLRPERERAFPTDSPLLSSSVFARQLHPNQPGAEASQLQPQSPSRTHFTMTHACARHAGLSTRAHGSHRDTGHRGDGRRAGLADAQPECGGVA